MCKLNIFQKRTISLILSLSVLIALLFTSATPSMADSADDTAGLSFSEETDVTGTTSDGAATGVTSVSTSTADGVQSVVTVFFSATTSEKVDYVNSSLSVGSALTETYYPEVGKYDLSGGVSLADALVRAHIAKYGSAFTKDPTKYLVLTATSNGVITATKQFGHETTALWYDDRTQVSALNTAVLTGGDRIECFSYPDNDTQRKLYCWFDQTQYEVYTGETLKLTVNVAAGSSGSVAATGADIYILNETTCEMTSYGVTVKQNGTASIQLDEAGSYYIAAKGAVTYKSKGKTYTYEILIPVSKVTVKTLDEDNLYTEKNGITYKLTSIRQKTAMVYDSDTDIESAVIPNTVTINGIKCKVTYIKNSAFYKRKNLKTVKIGNNVTSIGRGAFLGCTALKSVTIGKGVTRIETKAFFKCRNLKKITFKGKKLSIVYKKAFKKISKKAVFKAPKSVLKKYKSMIRAAGAVKKVKFKKL